MQVASLKDLNMFHVNQELKTCHSWLDQESRGIRDAYDTTFTGISSKKRVIWNFPKILPAKRSAESFGAKVIKVEKADEFYPALKKALHTRGVVLMDVAFTYPGSVVD